VNVWCRKDAYIIHNIKLFAEKIAVSRLLQHYRSTDNTVCLKKNRTDTIHMT